MLGKAQTWSGYGGEEKNSYCFEADHAPPSSDEVRNVWCYTSAPQFVFMAWWLVKLRVNFTLPKESNTGLPARVQSI